MSGFDSIQVRFKNTKHITSPFANTRIVPFVDSYFEILKTVVDDIKTEYFWFFSNFVDLKQISKFDLDFIPEQHEKNQIHVWYATHPMAGLNKEGNVLLIPTKKFKEQMHGLTFLRDFRDINYHAHPTLFQRPLSTTMFKLSDPITAYNTGSEFYTWMTNRDCDVDVPNFYPSFWEDEKMYTWGKTKDIILAPSGRNIKQLYDFARHVHFDYDYEIKPMDIVFLSYDEPSAEKYWRVLKEKYPRAKRIQGVKFPTIDLDPTFDFTFQPDRLREACHYIFHAKNPVNGLSYGHRAVILYNKHLCLSTIHPSLDFTLSQPHTVVPQLCGTSNFNQTPEISWRVAFREVLKLCEMKPTVESRHRLKKWCELGVGEYASYVQKGALDAVQYFDEVKGDKNALQLSYELEWLKNKFNSIS